MEIQGEGYEYDAMFYGGPLDGLEDSVVTLEKTGPPSHPFRVYEDEESFSPKPLGKKLIDQFKFKHIPNDAKVIVYQIEGIPDEYNDEDTIPYHFLEIVDFGEYKQKYL